MRNRWLSVTLLLLFLTSCTPETEQPPIPTEGQIQPIPTAIIVSPVPAGINTEETAVNTIPTITSSLPELPIVYYYFVAIESKTFPAGSVVILPDVLILGPTLSEYARSSDPTLNIESALLAMINDPRNAWTSKDLTIDGLTFKEGAAIVALQGEFFGVSDIVLIAARAQILMTVFAEEAVETAIITINGENIANLGISHSSEVKPGNFMYTRAGIQTFMSENAYTVP